MSIPVITIDGPSGSGKGTIAKIIAENLGYHLLDSGALYRLTALSARQQSIDWEDESAVAQVAAKLDIAFEAGEQGVKALLAGVDVSGDIRQEEMGIGASVVAAHPKVREALFELQQNYAKAPGLVADGRDMGTVVFPDAPAKIFLTASVEERAQRRYKQLLEKGESVSLRALLEDLQARDERDSQRAASPLVPAADALVLDSTEMPIEVVVKAVLDHVHQRCS